MSLRREKKKMVEGLILWACWVEHTGSTGIAGARLNWTFLILFAPINFNFNILQSNCPPPLDRACEKHWRELLQTERRFQQLWLVNIVFPNGAV